MSDILLGLPEKLENLYCTVINRKRDTINWFSRKCCLEQQNECKIYLPQKCLDKMLNRVLISKLGTYLNDLLYLLAGYTMKSTDYERPVRKSPSLHNLMSTPTPKFLDFFDLCLHWVSVFHAFEDTLATKIKSTYFVRALILVFYWIFPSFFLFFRSESHDWGSWWKIH